MQPYFEKTSFKVNMRYSACVSWPRSGHHLMVRLCQMYYGNEFGYCEFYGPDMPCCRSFPCKKRDVICISKNHDHQGELVFDDDCPIIIQYRDFIPSVVSNFELAVKGGRPDTRNNFAEFADKQLVKYNLFVKKWVYGLSSGDHLVVKYEDLIADPYEAVVRIIGLISPDHTVDEDHLRDVIGRADAETIERKALLRQKGAGVVQTRKVEDFRYYEKEVFDEIGRKLELALK